MPASIQILPDIDNIELCTRISLVNQKVKHSKLLKKAKHFTPAKLAEKKDGSYKSKASKIGETPNDIKNYTKDKKRYCDKINTEINLLLSKSALEFGYLDIDDDLVIQVIDKILQESFLSFVLSRDYVLFRLKNNSLPLHMKYSIIAVGSKLFENHVFFNNHLYMCGTVYADKAFEILSNDLGHPCIDKIFSALILVGHYEAVSSLTRTLFLTDLSIKYAYLLKMNIMDASKYNVSKSNDDWISLEYKRRVWWFLYLKCVAFGITFGSTNKISLKDVAVNLPSKDYLYHNYVTDPSLKFNKDNLPHNIDDNEIEKSDRFYLLVKAYITLGISSDFLNSTRIKLSNLPDNYHLKKSHVKERILKFEDFLRSHNSYLELDQNTSLPKKSSSELFISNRYLICYVVSIMTRLATIFVNMLDIVPYSLDPKQLHRSKVAKSICIDKAIEIMTLIKWSMSSFKLVLDNITVFYAANICGVILTNPLKIPDHPKAQKIRESFKYVFVLFKKHETCLTFLYELESSVRVSDQIFQKSIDANKNFLKLFPELKISQITKQDTNLWFVKPTSSALAYLCCSVSINSPIYKYIFIQNWFKNEVIKTRSPEYSMPNPVHKFTCSERIAFLDLSSNLKSNLSEANDLYKNSNLTIKTPYPPVNYLDMTYSLPKNQILASASQSYSYPRNLKENSHNYYSSSNSQFSSLKNSFSNTSQFTIQHNLQYDPYKNLQ
ncbi:hypothetical protein AYI69_g7851 [Smittium culicis]|uniref:Transcription factor domain-containing protein n=1 Tax=Smittium culicis TaxID=133412 RepID=A0A1R1XP90_9FUNG|nr:hypothetical protein AYI69_g7851 [Smittium culicis]